MLDSFVALVLTLPVSLVAFVLTDFSDLVLAAVSRGRGIGCNQVSYHDKTLILMNG